MGITSEEYLSLLPNNGDADTVKDLMQAYDEHPEWLVSADMHILDDINRTKMGESIKNIYTGGEPLIDHIGDGIRLSSDNIFTRSSIKYAEFFSKMSKVYFYQFSFDGELVTNVNNIHYEGAETVPHGGEAVYVFCYLMSCDISSYPESDQITRKRLLALWTNFIKYQNPTPEPSDLLQNVTWPPVDITNGDFFYLDINETLTIKNHPKEETYKAWITLYDSLGYNDFDTY